MSQVVTSEGHLFRLLVQNVQDYAIFTLSPEGIVESWNVGAQRMKGYAANEIVGRSFANFYTPEDRAANRPQYLLGQALKYGRVEDEGWRVRKDGTRFWADVVITALFDESGRLVGFGKVTRDMTEHRRAEEQRALRLAAERVADRMSRLQTFTAALSAASRPEQVAELLSTAGFAVIGAAAGAVALPSRDQDEMQVARQAGMGIVEVPQRIHRDDAHPMAEAWRIGEAVYIHSRESIVTNYPRLRSLAEGSIYEAWAAVPMFRERRLIAIMGMSYGEPRRFDEEERSMIMALAEVATQAIDRAQLFEMERRTRAEAEAALSAQDEFLSIASHELRTPVAAVKATAQLAQRAIARGGLEPARLQRHLESISRAADRLTGLVDDLLDVSRLRTGRLQLRRQLVDLSPLLEEIIERYRAQAPEVGGHVFRLTIPREPIQIDADPSRLEQVLDNFLSNAVKYSPTGGEIRVMADPDQGGVSITVTDSGIGLPHGQEERIFEPFGRASNAAIQQIPGLGLGLSICRELVEAHGGRIWASSPGEHRGTTVGMWLPLRGPAPTTEDGAIDP